MTWGRSSPAPRWRRRTSPAWPCCCASSTRAGRRSGSRPLIMNHATQSMKDNLLGSPVSATVMGAGRVRADALGRGRLGGRPGQPLVRARHRVRADRRRRSRSSCDNLDNTPAHYYGVGGRVALLGLRPTARRRSRCRSTAASFTSHADLRPCRRTSKQTVWRPARPRPVDDLGRPSRSSVGTTSTRTSTATSRSPRPAAARRHGSTSRGTSRRWRPRTTACRSRRSTSPAAAPTRCG